ncbi:MAG: RHS domain-containing protein, partial [Gammaproteobacteria bacterium]
MLSRSLIIVAAALWLLSGVALHAAVELPTGEYHQTADDLIVQVAGGAIRAQRTWYQQRWHFTRAWNNLDIEYDSYNGLVKRIERNRDRYRPIATPRVFVFDERKSIHRIDSGFRWQNREGDWIEYDAEGKPTRFGDRNNIEVRFAYNAAGRRSGVFDHHGTQVLWYEYEGDRLSAVRDNSTPPPRRVEYRYTGEQLTEVIDALGHSWRYEYNASGRMKKAVDPEGRPTHITYDASGRVASVVRADGTATNYKYDYNRGKREYYTYRQAASGRIEETWYEREGEIIRRDINGKTVLSVAIGARRWVSTDELGQKTIREYDEFDNLVGITYPDHSTTRYAIDLDYSNVLEETDENGVITQYEYDDTGNRIRMIEAKGTAVERTTAYRYDALGQLIEETRLGDADTAAAVTQYSYDPQGNRATMTDAEGHVTKYTAYDAPGNLLAWEDGRGKRWQQRYDARNQLIEQTDPLGNTVRFTYDGAGNRTQTIDQQGKVTRFTYSDSNRLTEVIDALGGVEKREYNTQGQVARLVDAENKAIGFDYNALDRISRHTDGNGNVIAYAYGNKDHNAPHDQISAITYPTYVSERRYDQRGRLNAVTQLADGETHTTTSRYDAVGNLIETTDLAGRTTRYAYDALNRLETTTNPAGHTVQYRHDNRDNVIEVINENGVAIRRFEYDRNNRQTQEIWPDNGTFTSAYDPNGNLIRRTDAKGQIIRYRYDDANRLIEQTTHKDPDAPATKTTRFTYDSRNQLKRYDDGATSGTYTYDALGRKTAETVDYGAFSLSHGYTYYKNGPKHTFTDASGVSVTYRYDPNNQLASLTIPDEGTITIKQYRWTAPAQILFPGGSLQRISRDGLLRPREIDVQDPAKNPILNTAYTFDANSNIIAKSTEHGDYRYGYDALDRLTAADNPTLADEQYTYDPAGNRLTDSDTEDTWQYNETNQLLAYGNTTLAYDNNGSPIKKTESTQTQTYTYNPDNRLTEISDGQQTVARYYYDPFGRRLWKETGNTKTYFFYTDEGLSSEHRADGTAIQRYGYAPDSTWTTNPLYTHTSKGYAFYLNDHLGTPRRLIQNNGATVWSAKQSAFGKTTIEQETFRNPLRFPGQYADEETGLHQNYFRDYDPGTGRYM